MFLQNGSIKHTLDYNIQCFCYHLLSSYMSGEGRNVKGEVSTGQVGRQTVKEK